MTKDKSIYSCFHPARIWNKYIQDYIVVPCGQCDFCAMARSAELKGRVEREALDPSNVTCLFVTLTYDNANLPVYELNPVPEIFEVRLKSGTVERREGYFFYSNREYKNPERYAPLCCDDISEYQSPVNHPSPNPVFGHLCYEDVSSWLGYVRNRFRYDLKCRCNNKNKNEINVDIELLDYEQTKFRYFLCGEYGPTSGRPHYHALIWFKYSFTDKDRAYISQVLSTCWTFGDVRIDNVKDGNCADYVASYVSSTNKLPEVLRTKSVRPFCTFSKFPTIGSYKISAEEIRKILDTGVVERTKFDAKESKEVPDNVFSASFYRRYFPKCSGFGYKDDTDKLRVYSYVYDYFKRKGVVHTAEDVYNISLSDIDWPLRVITDPYDDVYDNASSRVSKRVLHSCFDDNEELVDVEEWSYLDKYASLVCYRYCVMFHYTPYVVLNSLFRLYSKLASSALRDHYAPQMEATHYNTYCGHYINHDRFFMANLPYHSDDLRFYQLEALIWYGIDIEKLYPDGVISVEYRDNLGAERDPNYLNHKSKFMYMRSKKVKSKKVNDYTRSRKFGMNIINLRSVPVYGK